MKTLSEHVIRGAEHDSSDRDPPYCHPGTRMELKERINNWFLDKDRDKALLWLYGPAGVGKSAVMQTLAETLAESSRLGATLFFSRPNNRNDPQCAFITVAYQLATRIRPYRDFIVEKLVSNPRLLEKGMKEQFKIFIVEPFRQKGIGAGKEPWVILLDGLDECEGTAQQCDIIRLIGEFVNDSSQVPLIWVIASRQEPHIVRTFVDEVGATGYREEYMPVDSTEACRDVERYLNDSFKKIRTRFPDAVPSEWPSETQFLKLSNASSGLFVFVATATRFIEDPDYGDPVSRLDVIMSVIDHLTPATLQEQPFAPLDALYTRILEQMPQSSWRTARRILAFSLFPRRFDYHSMFTIRSKSLGAVMKILDLPHNVVYGSLQKLHSVLRIPTRQDAAREPMTFYHASFADYLMDPVRSRQFHIDDIDDIAEEVVERLFKIMQDFVDVWPESKSISTT